MPAKGADPSSLVIPRTTRTRHHPSSLRTKATLLRDVEQHDADRANAGSLNHTIFEGTSEIQQLVIARAISGLRIE